MIDKTKQKTSQNAWKRIVSEDGFGVVQVVVAVMMTVMLFAVGLSSFVSDVFNGSVKAASSQVAATSQIGSTAFESAAMAQTANRAPIVQAASATEGSKSTVGVSVGAQNASNSTNASSARETATISGPTRSNGSSDAPSSNGSDNAGSTNVAPSTAAPDNAASTNDAASTGSTSSADASQANPPLADQTVQTAGTLKQAIKTADGKRYYVTLDYGTDANIPEGAKLSVVQQIEIPEGYDPEDPKFKNRPYSTERFYTAQQMQARQTQLEKAVEVWEGDHVVYTEFLEIQIEADGAFIQPEAPVWVTVETDAVAAKASESVLMSFYTDIPAGSSTGLPLDVFNQSDDSNKKYKKGSKFTFQTDRLSDFGMVGVNIPLLIYEGDGMDATIYGPMHSAVSVADAYVDEQTLPEGAQLIDAFELLVNPDPIFGTELWMQIQEYGALEEQAQSLRAYRVVDGAATSAFYVSGKASDLTALQAGDVVALVSVSAATAPEEASQDTEEDPNKTTLEATSADLVIADVAENAGEDTEAASAESADATTDVTATNSASAASALATGTLINPLVASDGKPYEISVTFGPEAGIPEGTQLKVRELTGAEHDFYSACAENAVDAESSVGLRAFDIALIDPNGNEVQPQALIDVRIRLLDAAVQADDRETRVVHFGEEGPEVIAPATSVSKGMDTLDFSVGGFSVYVILTVPTTDFETVIIPDHPYHISNAVGSNEYWTTAMVDTTTTTPGLGKTTTLKDAGTFYFKQVAANKYHLYFMDGSTPTYLVFTRVNGDSAAINLSTTVPADDEAVEVLTSTANGRTQFSFKVVRGGSTSYANKFSDFSGSKIACWKDNNNGSKMLLTKADETSLRDPLGIDGRKLLVVHNDQRALSTSVYTSRTPYGLGFTPVTRTTESIDGQNLSVYTDTVESPATLWNFEAQNDGTYALSVNASGGKHYLSVAADNALILSDSPYYFTLDGTNVNGFSIFGERNKLRLEFNNSVYYRGVYDERNGANGNQRFNLGRLYGPHIVYSYVPEDANNAGTLHAGDFTVPYVDGMTAQAPSPSNYVVFTNAGKTQGYSYDFTHWEGEDGETYNVGDSLSNPGDNLLTLVSRWTTDNQIYNIHTIDNRISGAIDYVADGKNYSFSMSTGGSVVSGAIVLDGDENLVELVSANDGVLTVTINEVDKDYTVYPTYSQARTDVENAKKDTYRFMVAVNDSWLQIDRPYYIDVLNENSRQVFYDWYLFDMFQGFYNAGYLSGKSVDHAFGHTSGFDKSYNRQSLNGKTSFFTTSDNGTHNLFYTPYIPNNAAGSESEWNFEIKASNNLKYESFYTISLANSLRQLYADGELTNATVTGTDVASGSPLHSVSNEDFITSTSFTTPNVVGLHGRNVTVTVQVPDALIGGNPTGKMSQEIILRGVTDNSVEYRGVFQFTEGSPATFTFTIPEGELTQPFEITDNEPSFHTVSVGEEIAESTTITDAYYQHDSSMDPTIESDGSSVDAKERTSLVVKINTSLNPTGIICVKDIQDGSGLNPYTATYNSEVEGFIIDGAEFNADFRIVQRAVEFVVAPGHNTATEELNGEMPTVVGHSKRYIAGDGYQVEDLLSQDYYKTRIPANIGGNDSYNNVYEFAGWITEKNTVIQNGDTVDDTYDVDGDGVITLTTKWGNTYANNTTRRVLFYVSIKALSADIYNETVDISTDTKDFTREAYTSLMRPVDINSPTNGTPIVSYNKTNGPQRTVTEADSLIRMLGEDGLEYGGVTYSMVDFPSDEDVLESIRTDPNVIKSNSKITLDGVQVDPATLTPENYTIQWYVCKYQGTNQTQKGWHIDGKLTPKVSFMTVSKTFAGDQAALDAVQTGVDGFAIHMTPHDDEGSSETVDPADMVNYKLVLVDQTNNTQHYGKLDDYSISETNSTRGYTRKSGNTYTWMIPTSRGAEFNISEENYDVEVAGTNYGVIAQAMVIDEHGESIGPPEQWFGTVPGSSATYPREKLDLNAIETLNLTNTYVETGTFVIRKIDGGPIKVGMPGVNFRVYQVNDNNTERAMRISLKDGTTANEGRYEVNLQGVGSSYMATTGDDGYLYLRMPVPQATPAGDTTYTFRLEEIVPDGYKKREDEQAPTFTIVVNEKSEFTVVNDEAHSTVDPEGSEIEFLKGSQDGDTVLGATITNMPELLNATVVKTWDAINKENNVTIDLTASVEGEPKITRTATLQADEDDSTPVVSDDTAADAAQYEQWDYTFTEMPLAIGNKRAIYSVEETKIGRYRAGTSAFNHWEPQYGIPEYLDENNVALRYSGNTSDVHPQDAYKVRHINFDVTNVEVDANRIRLELIKTDNSVEENRLYSSRYHVYRADEDSTRSISYKGENTTVEDRGLITTREGATLNLYFGETYYLNEIEAPVPFCANEGFIKIEVGNSGEVEWETEASWIDSADLVIDQEQRKGTLTMRDVPAICKIDDQNGEHAFPTLRAAISYAREKLDGNAQIEMLIDYLMPETDSLTESYSVQDGEDITLTTAEKTGTSRYRYREEGEVSTVTRGFNGASMFTDYGAFSLNNIVIDGNKATYSSSADGGIVHIASGSFAIGEGAVLHDSYTSAKGGAVYVAAGASASMSSGAVYGNAVDTDEQGAGIYLDEGSELHLSGSPNFGEGNFVNVNLVDMVNGGEAYPQPRQDIYLKGYAEDNATSLVVDENLGSGEGSIWVWPDAELHRRSLDQFAVVAEGFTITPATGMVFRNARDDATSQNETGGYLYGVAGEGDQAGFLFWNSPTDLRRVVLKKINDKYEPLKNATFHIYRSNGTLVTEEVNGEQRDTFTSGDSGVYFAGDLNVGTYYLQEFGYPEGVPTNGETGWWYILTVGEDKTEVSEMMNADPR